MKNKKKEIKYERFGRRTSVGGRFGVRAHWAPLNLGSATMQFVVYMYFRLSGWRHVYSQSSTQKARVWRMLKVTHPGAAWVRYDLRRRLIFPIVFLKLNTCSMQAQFSDSGPKRPRDKVLVVMGYRRGASHLPSFAISGLVARTARLPS